MAMERFLAQRCLPKQLPVVKKALSDGKPVAAAYGSIIILAEAGLLKGRNTHSP